MNYYQIRGGWMDRWMEIKFQELNVKLDEQKNNFRSEGVEHSLGILTHRT